MNFTRLVSVLRCAAFALLCTFVACKGAPAPTTEAEQYTAADGAVGFDIMRSGANEAGQRWLATYTDGTSSTRFTLELEPAAVSGASGAPAMGKGRFLAQTDSDPTPLLERLKRALQAKRMPSGVQKADELPFGYLLVGENQSRTPTGSFRSSPLGDWEVMKIFLANDQAEVYLNLNPRMHKAEFSIKDASYGDRVLAELARVF